jgi:hypothetical protein
MERKEEMNLMFSIAKRAEEMNLMIFDRMSLVMDLDNTHKDCGLRLNDLLNADDINFVHDIMGIQNNMDRKTGKLVNCFLPRFHK